MDNHSTVSFAQFCIAQRNEFDADDWYLRFDTDGEAVAIAAKYLSMTSWYGHGEDLEHIASRMHGVVDNCRSLYRKAQAIGFDLPHFSSKVHHGVIQTPIDQETYA